MWKEIFIVYLKIQKIAALSGTRKCSWGSLHAIQYLNSLKATGSTQVMDLMAVNNSWKLTVKNFNGFRDILAGVLKNFISRKSQ